MTNLSTNGDVLRSNTRNVNSKTNSKQSMLITYCFQKTRGLSSDSWERRGSGHTYTERNGMIKDYISLDHCIHYWLLVNMTSLLIKSWNDCHHFTNNVQALYLNNIYLTFSFLTAYITATIIYNNTVYTGLTNRCSDFKVALVDPLKMTCSFVRLWLHSSVGHWIEPQWSLKRFFKAFLSHTATTMIIRSLFTSRYKLGLNNHNRDDHS